MKDGERQMLCFIVLAMLLSIIPTVKAWSRWDPRFAQIEQPVREWYRRQEMTKETWQRLGSPSWKSCCAKGDVFHTQFRVLNNGTKYGEDTWWYEKDGVWKQVPPDTIHWGQHTPDGPRCSSIKAQDRSFASTPDKMGNNQSCFLGELAFSSRGHPNQTVTCCS